MTEWENPTITRKNLQESLINSPIVAGLIKFVTKHVGQKRHYNNGYLKLKNKY